MNEKYASFGYVQNREDLFANSKIMMKSPLFMQNWYLNKYSTYEIEEIDNGLSVGYFVKLPLVLEEAKANPDAANELTENVLYDLASLGVGIVLPPKNLPYSFPSVIRFAGSGDMMIFLLRPLIKKALKMMGKDMKNAEIVILGGDESAVFSILDVIYPFVNFLAVLGCETPMYEEKAIRIFDECGLNLLLKTESKSLLENADIIINTSCLGEKFGHSYKKGAIYIDVSHFFNEAALLASKRQDIQVFNSFNLNFNGEKINADTLEAYFFPFSKRYRYFLQRGYSCRAVNEIAREIEMLELGTPMLTFQKPSYIIS